MNLPCRTLLVLITLTLWASLSSLSQTTTPAATQKTDSTPVQGSSAAVTPTPGAAAKSDVEALKVPAVVVPAGVVPAGVSPAVVSPAVVPAPAAPEPMVAGEAPAKPRAVKGKKGEANSPPPPAESDDAPYVIGSLDLLDVQVWNDAKLSGYRDVRPDGVISMPLIGEIKADGLTVPQLTSVIKGKLRETVMEDPEVTIQVARINSKKYTIFGGCARQGEFPLVGPTTVLDAFANCGGFKDFANLKKIYILRGTQRFPFNYKDVSQGKHMEQNIRLHNGDRIFVPE